MKTTNTQEGGYRITVQGHLNESWVGRLGNMKLLETRPKDEVTVIQGQVRYQSELSGILNTLYELHLKLVSVEFIGQKKSQ